MTGGYDIVLMTFIPLCVVSAVVFGLARRPRLRDASVPGSGEPPFRANSGTAAQPDWWVPTAHR